MSTISAQQPTTISTERLRELIAQELPELTTIRRDLHTHPELRYEEHRTSGVVQEQLSMAGVAFKAGLAKGTGILGHLPGASDRAIGLRADMDALPIVEETSVSYASQTPGKMHACGHDGHTTILIGAARILAKVAAESELPNPVSFVFQPAEEGGAGGDAMVKDGCLDGSVIGMPIAHMFGLHGWPEMNLGCVGSRRGPMLAAADMFDITIHGTGCHAAFPHMGRDPILAGAAMVQALQQISSRNVGPLDSVVISTTQFHAGTTHNIVPERITLSGTVRTLLPEVKDLAVERMHAIVEHIARAHDCEATLNYHDGYPVTHNDPQATDVFHDIARDALGHECVQPLDDPVMGGEDFSFYCQVVPSCFFALGLLPDGQTTMPQLHQPTFDFNDDALPIGIELFCQLALGVQPGR